MFLNCVVECLICYFGNVRRETSVKFRSDILYKVSTIFTCTEINKVDNTTMFIMIKVSVATLITYFGKIVLFFLLDSFLTTTTTTTTLTVTVASLTKKHDKLILTVIVVIVAVLIISIIALVFMYCRYKKKQKRDKTFCAHHINVDSKKDDTLSTECTIYAAPITEPHTDGEKQTVYQYASNGNGTLKMGKNSMDEMNMYYQPSNLDDQNVHSTDNRNDNHDVYDATDNPMYGTPNNSDNLYSTASSCVHSGEDTINVYSSLDSPVYAVTSNNIENDYKTSDNLIYGVELNEAVNAIDNIYEGNNTMNDVRHDENVVDGTEATAAFLKLIEPKKSSKKSVKQKQTRSVKHNQSNNKQNLGYDEVGAVIHSEDGRNIGYDEVGAVIHSEDGKNLCYDEVGAMIGPD